jgi:hypothetical protein
MKFTIFISLFLLCCSANDLYCQSFIGKYKIYENYDKNRLRVYADSTFQFIERSWDTSKQVMQGKWIQKKDTLILNPDLLPKYTTWECQEIGKAKKDTVSFEFIAIRKEYDFLTGNLIKMDTSNFVADFDFITPDTLYHIKTIPYLSCGMGHEEIKPNSIYIMWRNSFTLLKDAPKYFELSAEWLHDEPIRIYPKQKSAKYKIFITLNRFNNNNFRNRKAIFNTEDRKFYWISSSNKITKKSGLYKTSNRVKKKF